MRRLIPFSILFAMAWPAMAATPEAWKELNTRAADACRAESGLRKPKVIQAPVLFNSAVLLRIQGTWPQPHMKGKTGKVWCLYPIPQGKPEIAE